MLVYAAINLSVVTWIIRSYMLDIPEGAGGRREAPMALPICASCGRSSSLPSCPGIITAGGDRGMIFAINEFLFTLLIASTPNAYTMSVALANFTGGSDGVIYNAIALVAFHRVSCRSFWWWLRFKGTCRAGWRMGGIKGSRASTWHASSSPGIQKRWGAVWGVRDVDLDIADEELVVFLGPSGCGKTTTMRMIAGLEDPTEGKIRMDGEVMNDIDPATATSPWSFRVTRSTPT